jgi:DNA-binding SARP family transcriptional activator
LTLTGEFELAIAGRNVTVPHSAERVLAYLALTDRPVSRSRLAGTLWSDSSEIQAAKCLRTALWRLHRVDVDLVSGGRERLRLSPVVAVDAVDLADLARGLIGEPTPTMLGELPRLMEHTELLPDWDDPWIVADRERYRLLRLEALESAALAFLGQQRLGDALVAALAATHSEPLRESARRIVVEVEIAQGNIAEALRSFHEYRRLLRDQFGVEPSPVLEQLVAPWRRARTEG